LKETRSENIEGNESVDSSLVVFPFFSFHASFQPKPARRANSPDIFFKSLFHLIVHIPNGNKCPFVSMIPSGLPDDRSDLFDGERPRDVPFH
jgi:hypothetical protein